jgi:CobQ-like glutamine amidotransferase family enzyme
MALPGETEVFFITPEKGKCYEHAEATRTERIGMFEYKYYTTNKLKYVGEFVNTTVSGSGDAQSVISHFLDSKSGTENHINHSYRGNTCFLEVPCLGNLQKANKVGGKRKTYRKKNCYRKYTRRNNL